MKQRDKEWYMARLGLFTGSQIHKIMGPKGFGQTGETYIYERVAEVLTGISPESRTTEAMQWGIDAEPWAVSHFEAAFDIKTEPAFFLTNEDYPGCGASPDRLIPDIKTGIEIKCPFNSANHVKYMSIKGGVDLKKIAKEYYWQIQMGLLLSGYDKWDFISYDPRFDDRYMMYVVTIYPEPDDIALLKERLLEAVKMKTELLTKIQSL